MGGTPGNSQITPDEVLAQEALKRGFIQPEQLKAALSEQAREVSAGRAKPRPLLNILISKGFLSTEQVTVLRGENAPKPKQDAQKYSVKDEIARGGMGAILRAEDRQIRRQVAMKVMLDAEDEKSRSRFLEEAQVTGQLEHPNIVPVHELGVDAQGRPFFTMKLVKGRSLADVLKTQRDEPEKAGEYTLPRLLNIFGSVCNAIAFAHSKGVVHRDLKPANLMLGDYGEVLVMDWGLAKVGAAKTKTGRWLEDSEATNSSANQKLEEMVKSLRQETVGSKTLDGALLGTPHYMPPEQAAGEIHKIDARSDIYSLGAILYEILTLKPPVEAKTLQELLMKVARGEIVPPNVRMPEKRVPLELAAVAMKALSTPQERRYQSAIELRQDIDLYLEGKAVSAKEDTAWETVVKLVRRNKGESLAAAVAFILLLFGGALSTWINREARKRAEHSEVVALEQRGIAERERKTSDQALIDYRSEQTRRLEQESRRQEERKRSAPLFLEVARGDLLRKQFDAALLQVIVATEYDPGLAEARLLKAQLLVAKRDYPAAVNDLETYLKLRPDDKNAANLRELAIRSQTEETLDLAISEALAQQGAFVLAETRTQSADRLMKLWEQRLENSFGGKVHLRLNADGTLQCWFDPDMSDPLDLASLTGLPITQLNLSGAPVRDLSPLRGMPLRRLNLESTLVQDLSPLADMPLTWLNLYNCRKLTDLSPLKGLPLTTLNVRFNSGNAPDLAPLAGMPLRELYLGQHNATTLAPLKGMPLTFLSISDPNPLSDLSPLAGMPLTKLHLAKCGTLSDLGPLAGMPLTELTLDWWTNLQDISPLKGMPLTVLHIGQSKVKDLSPLRGMPLTSLDLTSTPVDDIAPLQGMPLTYLSLAETRIRDLHPLCDSPLQKLVLSRCHGITDLTPLGKVPLTTLVLSEDRVDLTPLKGMRLKYLSFSPKLVTRGMEIVREMSTLQKIAAEGYDPENAGLPERMFWKRFDAGAPFHLKNDFDPNPFIQEWLVLDPIKLPQILRTHIESLEKPILDKTYFEGQYSAVPRDGDTAAVDGDKLLWRRVVTNTFGMDLMSCSRLSGRNSEDSLFLGVTILQCEQEFPELWLSVGSDDSSAWRLNGAELGRIYEGAELKRDRHLLGPAPLRKGRNVLGFSVINGAGGSGACARFVDKDGKSFTQFKVTLGSPGPK